MDPAQFLETAESLAKGIREGDWRSSVSRAYYSAYHVVWQIVRRGVDRALLIRAQWMKQIPHHKLIASLKGASDKEVKEAGRMLDDLRASRRIADYKLDCQVGRAKAEEACVNAGDLNNEVTGLTSSRIAPAVSAYIADNYQ